MMPISTLTVQIKHITGMARLYLYLVRFKHPSASVNTVISCCLLNLPQEELHPSQDFSILTVVEAADPDDLSFLIEFHSITMATL